MSYEATAIDVMIATPSDVENERKIIREVIHEWNAVNSKDRQLALMPIGWETHSAPSMGSRPQEIINKQILRDCDLLIAAFWTRLGTDTGKAPSGTVEEITEHLDAGKPVMIYFSDAPVHPDSIDETQYKALKDFKGECREKGLIETYETLGEFKEKLSRQLHLNVLREFKEIESPEILSPIFEYKEPTLQLSEDAKTLLLAAVADRSGIIMHLRTMGGSSIQTNGENLLKDNTSREEARWKSALDELYTNDLIEDRGYKGEVFRVTHKGYEFADKLKLEK